MPHRQAVQQVLPAPPIWHESITNTMPVFPMSQENYESVEARPPLTMRTETSLLVRVRVVRIE